MNIFQLPRTTSLCSALAVIYVQPIIWKHLRIFLGGILAAELVDTCLISCRGSLSYISSLGNKLTISYNTYFSLELYWLIWYWNDLKNSRVATFLDSLICFCLKTISLIWQEIIDHFYGMLHNYHKLAILLSPRIDDNWVSAGYSLHFGIVILIFNLLIAW